MPSLRPIGQNVAALHDDEDGSAQDPEWDVFVSHATEDKDEVVRPLAHALQEMGLRVWYDEFEFRIGDSLRRKIDLGISRTRFGVVVLSHSFFSKNWPQHELDGLVTREMSGEQVILPLWHKITKTEVMSYSPTLADKVARNTSDLTVEEIAKEIAEVVTAPASQARVRTSRRRGFHR
jgi:TIR domain-containing protein